MNTSSSTIFDGNSTFTAQEAILLAAENASSSSPTTITNLTLLNRNDDTLENKILRFYLATVIIVFGLLGNLLTFLTIIRSDLRKSYVNKYLLVLLASDSELLLKLAIERVFHPGRINFCACFAAQYFWNLPIYISNLTILLLTLERLLAIVFPLNHLKYSHFGRWKIIIVMLLTATIINFNLLFVLENNDRNAQMREKCTYNYDPQGHPFARTLYLAPRILLTFLFPLLAVICVNVAIIVKLRARSLIQSTATASPDARTNNKILFIIPAFYVLFNFPYNSYLTLGFLFKNIATNQTKNLIFLDIFFLNHAINFVLYALASKNFRQTVTRLWIHPIMGIQKRNTNSEESKETQETKL